jgi:hypothetical protein
MRAFHLPRTRARRALAAVIASAALVLTGSVVFVPSPATAAMPLPPPPDFGYTYFPDEVGMHCTSSDDDYLTPGHYSMGWVQMPDGVHHAKVTAVGEPGTSGFNGGGAGGAAGAVTAIVPTTPGELLYASPGSMLSDEVGSNVTGPGGHASIVSSVDPEAACNEIWDYPHYPADLPGSSIVVVAGGGGGGGNNAGGGKGGDAGAVSGGTGGSVNGGGGGSGGTQTAGGAPGSGTRIDGDAGVYLAGGAEFNAVEGGNGGAGFYGGAGGGSDDSGPGGGGGGGSNHVMTLPDDGVSQVLSDGTTTGPGYVSIVPIYEPTVSISAPVNPSVVHTPTTIVVTVSGLPTAKSNLPPDPGVRPAATGTVTLTVNGADVQRSFDPLVGPDTGVRTATFTPSLTTSGDVSFTARYNGDGSQEFANTWADITDPETSPAFIEHYLPAVTTTVSGAMTYGDSTAAFTHSESLPSGVTISGTANCTTADSGNALSALSAVNHLIDPASCSGLTLGGPNAANYALLYAGSVTVAPKLITATVTGNQPVNGTPTFTVDATTPTGITIAGTPSCPTLSDGTAIAPTMQRGVYTLGNCTGLTLAGTDPADYALTVTGGQFVAGTSAPTVSLVNATGDTFGSPFEIQAKVAGSGSDAGGTLTWSFYDGAGCTGIPLSITSQNVTGDGDYDSGPTTPSHPGAFSWKAEYSGDTFNIAATSACADVTAAKLPSGMTINTPAAGIVGQPLSASVTFSSSAFPFAAPRSGGDLRFILYPLSDTTCSGETALILTDDIVSNDGTFISGSYMPTTPGTYRWVVLYGGDDDHTSVLSTCTLTTVVSSPPVITSNAATTFNVGTNGGFTVTTTPGSATPTTLSVSGTLPHGVTFIDNGDGTATLTGTPGTTAGGSYPLTITADDGPASSTQSFVLTVAQPAAITSGDTATFTTGRSGSMTITTTAGYPTSTALTIAGALPSGVQFVDNNDGTATLTGTPDATTGGSYPLTISAGNGTAPDATQSFTLTVDQHVAIAATDQVAFQVGQNGTHTVTTTTGFPTATQLSMTGTLPAGVSFVDNNDGTASLSGTPLAGSGGVYQVTIAADNAVGTAAQQQLDITVNEAPVFTSVDTASPTLGVASNITVDTVPGYPTAYSLTSAGTLPPGLSLLIAGGSATITGTPAGVGGVYPITFTASNGVAPATVQTLTLTVAAASAAPLPAILPTVAGTIAGVPATTQPGETFDASASGFAVGAPITWGVYSSPRMLTTSVADLDGNATAHLTIPAGFAGIHTIVATGIAPDGSARVATATTTVIAPASASARLAFTGSPVDGSPFVALVLLVLGLMMVLVVRVRRVARRTQN